MIRATIYDLGGVYFSIDYENLQNFIAGQFPEIPSQKIKQITCGPIGQDYRLGKYTKQEFWESAREMVGFSFDAERFAELWHSSYRLNAGVRDILRRLRKDHSICALSGTTEERMESLDRRHGFRRDFDVIVCSHSVGANKPHPRIYREALKRPRLTGKECVFIDDTED